MALFGKVWFMSSMASRDDVVVGAEPGMQREIRVETADATA